MASRTEILNHIYNRFDENSRLSKNRAGQLEYVTTMNYIHRFLQPGFKILEVGAGTGTYSVRLAKEGFDVTAVELVEKNLEQLKQNALNVKNIQALQGDATDLSGFEDESFDLTLVLGPMYHLYEVSEVHKAIDEALRVTRKGGVIMFAFLSIYAIMMDDHLFNGFEAGIKENFDADFNVVHTKEQGFTGYGITEFEKLFDGKNIEPMKIVATDGSLELAEKSSDLKISDHNFNLLCKYHLATCEQRELLGSSSHLLYICKKNNG